MSPGPLDPASALKKLFERHRSARPTAPQALFRPAQPGEAVPPPAGPSPGQPAEAPRGGILSPVVAAGRRAGARLRTFAQRIPRRSPKRQGVIGVDIGASALKVVRLEPVDGRNHLTEVIVEEWPGGTSEDLARELLLRDRLKELKRLGKLGGPIVFSFHHQDSLVETLRLPKMPASELEQAVLWEARERLSVKLEHSVVRFLLTGEVQVEGQPQLEILLMSVPKEPLLAYWRGMAELGLRVVAVEPTNLAAYYPLEALNLWKPTELVGHLEIGMKMSHLSFIRGGSVHFNRSFPVAGDSVTRAIADYCQVDYSVAEELKCRIGISKMALEEDRHEAGHEAEDRVRVSHALGLHLEQMVAEIEHSFRYYSFEMGGTDATRMDRLLLTGGGALLKYLPEFLSSRLTTPVDLADPSQGLEVEPALEPGWTQRLAVPIGLAGRRLG